MEYIADTFWKKNINEVIPCDDEKINSSLPKNHSCNFGGYNDSPNYSNGYSLGGIGGIYYNVLYSYTSYPTYALIDDKWVTLK